jgi:hypothetical protein
VNSGGTTGGVHQQQGNANRASVAGRCPMPIFSLVNNKFHTQIHARNHIREYD